MSIPAAVAGFNANYVGGPATAGVDVQQVVARGVLHGFLNLPAEVDPVGRVLDLMAAAVAATPASIPHPVPVS